MKQGHSIADHQYGDGLAHTHDGLDADHDHDNYDTDGPLEENPIWIADHVTLTSVGMDIGSSGTQVIFSKMNLRRFGEDLSSRYYVVSRETLYQSPVSLTPYRSEELIDDAALGAIIDRAYEAAGLHPDAIDTGVVILTGEALRRENAQAIAAILAEQGGEFVCATAGHHMEAMLAAYGSGAARASHDLGKRILNIDIGGGTTKLALVEQGKVLATAAVHIGGRLQVVDAEHRIVRLDPAGKYHASRAGFDWSRGEFASDADMDRVAQGMADTLLAALNTAISGQALDHDIEHLYLTDLIRDWGEIEGVMFSGGVAEYVYQRETRDFGDMGRRLGLAVRERVESGALPWPLLPAGECMRATALGASEYSVQLSGNTTFISSPGELLPRRNLQVLLPEFKFAEHIDEADVAQAIAAHFTAFDRIEGEGEVALAFRWAGAPSYERISAFARGIVAGLPKTIAAGAPIYIMLDGDIAQTLGAILREELAIANELLVIDGVTLQDFDYIDLGRVRLPSQTVPVTIKSLVFSEDPRAPDGRQHLIHDQTHQHTHTHEGAHSHGAANAHGHSHSHGGGHGHSHGGGGAGDEAPSFWQRFDPKWLIFAACVVFVAWLALVPLGFLLWQSFFTPETASVPAVFTLDNYKVAYSSVETFHLFINSARFAAGAAIFAFVVGAFLAWVNERTNTPFKSLFFGLSIIPLVIPSILFTVAWIFLASPKIGILNQVLQGAFGTNLVFFNIYSMTGMIWVDGLHYSPIAFLLMTAAFRSMDPSLEESALMSGASVFQIARRITFKLAWPAALASLLILFVRAIESFEVPALLGLPVGIHVYTSAIFEAIRQYPSKVGLASAYGITLLIIAGLGLYFQSRLSNQSSRFSTVTGKGFRPRPMDLGRWRYLTAAIFIAYLMVVVILPFLVLVWSSLHKFYSVPSMEALKTLTLDPYRRVFEFPALAGAVWNSIVLSLGAATVIMLVTSVICWIVVKSKMRGRIWLDNLASLPLVFPGIVLGLSIMIFYLHVDIGVYGTFWIMFIAYVTRFMPYGLRYNMTSMLQIHKELEESAAMSGASWGSTFWRIVLPLLKPGLIAGWIYVVIVSVRELSSSILLYGPGKEVISIVIWEFWQNGQYVELSALGVMMIVSLFCFVMLAQLASRKLGIKEA
ncbi:MAG: ethanolamine ammonia-lyase reactivating factor EutA [Burkholderiales bacterium]